METNQKFEFKELPYAYDALEPYIDKLTMEIHYSRHHKGYYNNFLNAIKDTELESMDIEDIFKNVSKYSPAVRNNSGGYYNHTFFWESMTPAPSCEPSSSFLEIINRSFSSFDEFEKQFSDAAKTRFGSGWAWLCADNNGKLFISSTPNQDNPLMDVTEKNGIPLLGLDVWEHAYYLKYQNKRPDYIEAFFNLIDWEKVEERYDYALKALESHKVTH